MLRYSRTSAALALAMSLSASVLTPMAVAYEQDDRSANDYKIATNEDMVVPDRSGHVIVKRDAHKIVACTSDDHFVLTYIFPQSMPQNKKFNTSEKVDAYLNTMHRAFMSASRAHSAAIFNVGQHYPISLPPKLYQRLEAASNAFNKANNTGLNWMIRMFTTSDEPYQPCIDSRLKNLTPSKQDNAKVIKWMNDKKSKRATWEDMNVPNANGVVLVDRYPASVGVCTTDNYLVYGDIYAAALPQDAEHVFPHTPLLFSNVVQDAFIKAAQALPAKEFIQRMTPQISLPPTVLQSMRDAATEFNTANKDKGAPMKWLMFKYQITSEPNEICKTQRSVKL